MDFNGGSLLPEPGLNVRVAPAIRRPSVETPTKRIADCGFADSVRSQSGLVLVTPLNEMESWTKGTQIEHMLVEEAAKILDGKAGKFEDHLGIKSKVAASVT